MVSGVQEKREETGPMKKCQQTINLNITTQHHHFKFWCQKCKIRERGCQDPTNINIANNINNIMLPVVSRVQDKERRAAANKLDPTKLAGCFDNKIESLFVTLLLVNICKHIYLCLFVPLSRLTLDWYVLICPRK